MPEPEKSAYLDYLPAIYSDKAGDGSGPTLAQFLIPFEAEFEGLRDLLAEIDHFFDPALAPTNPDFLAWLAEWMALTLDQSWDVAKRRQILSQAVTLYRYRGTAEGIARFLDIYTGRWPRIEEAWPAGFQIGVASQLPVVEKAPPPPDPKTAAEVPGALVLTEVAALDRREPAAYYDYYIVRTPLPAAGSPAMPGCDDLPADHPVRRFMERRAAAPDAAQAAAPEALEVYYRADKVVGVDLAASGDQQVVTVQLTGGRAHCYAPASIIRQDHVIEEIYDLAQGQDALVYKGDSLLIESMQLPHRFTVHLSVPADEWNTARQPAHVSRLRSIIDEVKPAHTVYALRITPAPPAPPQPGPGRVGVDLHIGIDSVL